MEEKSIFCENLNRILKEKEVSQHELARRMGVTPQAVNTWCKGIAMPRMKKVDKICHCLNILRGDLLNEYVEKEETEETRLAKQIMRLSAYEKKIITNMIETMNENKEV